MAGLAAALALPRLARAQDFPVRPVRLLVGFAAGGATDLAFRATAEQAGRLLGQPVLVENRTGAGGTLPAQALQTAPADGYTLAHLGVAVYRLPLTTQIAWDPYRDITHVVQLAGYELGVLASATGPVRSWNAFAATARLATGAASYATSGVLTAANVTMERIAERLGVRLTHVPYRGGPEIRQAVLAGQVTAGVDALGPQVVSSGLFQVLCIWTEHRSPTLPDVPTLTELGVPIVETSPFGIGAPRGTPAAVVARLHDAFRLALQHAAVRTLFERERLVAQYLDSRDYLQAVQERHANERQGLARLGLLPG